VAGWQAGWPARGTGSPPGCDSDPATRSPRRAGRPGSGCPASRAWASPTWTATDARTTSGRVTRATSPMPVVSRMSAVRVSPRPISSARLWLLSPRGSAHSQAM
jgi:hypothetical protein